LLICPPLVSTVTFSRSYSFAAVVTLSSVTVVENFQITHLYTTVINSGRTTQLTTAHTVGLHWLRCVDCSYNPGWCLSHPTVAKMA